MKFQKNIFLFLKKIKNKKEPQKDGATFVTTSYKKVNNHFHTFFQAVNMICLNSS